MSGQWLDMYNATLASTSAAGNTTDDVLMVICAWPVSGQYGPGSRVLYYVLIATCLLGRNVNRLVNAFLAVGLILPAVAALHGIALAVAHEEGAVDMDIFGAFQLCSIGILAAPVTVMMSRTFFNDPGRNIMFLWTLLVLVGLLCLGVEFYRIEPHGCPFTDATQAHTVSPRASDFPYADGITCGLRCSPDTGPKSPMRGGAADDVFVVPAPSILNFGTATLLTAACCVHAVLSLISMWNKVVTRRWMLRWRRTEHSSPAKTWTEPANMTLTERINDRIGYFLSMVAVPVFGGAGVAIVIVGELNFFSPQVRYQTEPMACVGQWAPIAGTGLAMLGSLYLIFADTDESESEPHGGGDLPGHPLREVGRGRGPLPAPSSSRDSISPETQNAPQSSGGRHKFTHFMFRMGDVLGSPPKAYLRKASRENEVPTYPYIPGELERHEGLSLADERFHQIVSSSRAGSFRGSSPSPPRGSRSISPSTWSDTLPNQTQAGDRGRQISGLAATAEAPSMARATSQPRSPRAGSPSGIISQNSRPVSAKPRAATLPSHSHPKSAGSPATPDAAGRLSSSP